MDITRPSTKCRRCGRPYSEHDKTLEVTEGAACPDTPQSVFQKTKNKGVSQSFTQEQTRLLVQIFEGFLNTGVDLRNFSKDPVFKKLLRKVLVMKNRLRERRAEKG